VRLPIPVVLWGVVNAAVESRAAGLPAEMYFMDDDYRSLIETNLLGAAAVTSAFMPLLIASRGRVVNTGCLSGLIDIPANAAYNASMSALVAWSESLRFKGAITSKIKHAIKHKTSPASFAQLLHNCCSPHWHFVRLQQLCKSCRTCFKF